MRIILFLSVAASVTFFSCGLLPAKPKESEFYQTFSDWDIIYVPIIQPLQASSIDGGRSWLISGITDVSSFGVSDNFIYGMNMKGWFLYNVKSGLYAQYQTMDELTSTLTAFKVPQNPIDFCGNYFKDTLPAKGRCYWFPKTGEKYPEYEEIIPSPIIDLSVFGDSSAALGFKVKPEIRHSKTKIYYFKVHSDKKENDLLYFSINQSPPVLVKGGIIIPVFIPDEQFNITLYTPFPVAQEKGIKENERIHIGQDIKIKK